MPVQTHWGVGPSKREMKAWCGNRGPVTTDIRRVTCLTCGEHVDQMGPNARPNIPPPRFRARCPDSKYGDHRFVADGGRRCEFCGAEA